MLVSPEGVKLERLLRLGFRASNNEAEYEALITGLRAAKNLKVKEVEMFSDSRVVVSQIEGSFEARDHRMSQYLKMLRNSYADSLAKLASSLDGCIPQMITVELLE